MPRNFQALADACKDILKSQAAIIFDKNTHDAMTELAGKTEQVHCTKRAWLQISTMLLLLFKHPFLFLSPKLLEYNFS